MRSVPSDISSKLALLKQTKANQADPSANIWIGRPTTPLTTDIFLENQTVLTAAVTDTAIAVCHPRTNSESTRIYIAYVDNGVAKVVTAATKTKMESHIWVDTGFSENASAVAIAFDGTMPKDRKGNVEFITELMPWVFWVDSGALYGQKLGTDTIVTLAETNCTDVAAVRAMWSDVGDFDFGLCLFFILGGSLYYRQYINGEWTDAAPITFGPAGAVYTAISASRTWDYRVVLQAKANTGIMYELYTQFMGIGKQNAEHIEIDITSDSELIKVDYTNTELTEHVEITNISAEGEIIYGLTSIPTSVYNVDNGTGNYGLRIIVVFDHPIHSIENQQLRFVLTDGNNITYTCTALTLSENGLILTLTMPDFNLAALGLDCSLTYTPGSILCAATSLAGFSYDFIPTNLVAPDIDPPEVEVIWNE